MSSRNNKASVVLNISFDISDTVRVQGPERTAILVHEIFDRVVGGRVVLRVTKKNVPKKSQ